MSMPQDVLAERSPLYVPAMLMLPNGDLVLQRRTDDADYGKDQLGMFGGGAKPGETPIQCLLREVLKEELVINASIVFQRVVDYEIPPCEGYGPRHFTLYMGVLPDLRLPTNNGMISDSDLKAREGKWAEARSRQELSRRRDCTTTTEYLLDSVLGLVKFPNPKFRDMAAPIIRATYSSFSLLAQD